MAHQRKVIRDAAAAALTNATAAGPRVFAARKIALRRLELPALAVYALQEAVDPASIETAPRELTRNLKLVIEAQVEGGNVDDALDAISAEIEKAIDADETLAGAAAHAILETTDLDVFESGDRAIGSAILTYAVTYYTYAPEAEDVPLVDFVTADVKTAVNSASDPAEDVVTLP